MLETPNHYIAHECHASINADKTVTSEKSDDSKQINSINFLNTVSNSNNEHVKASMSSSSLTFKSISSLNNSILYQNPNNSHSNRSLSNKLPLNSYHKMTLGKPRNCQNSNSGFPTKIPEIKKKVTSGPPEEVKTLELKIQLVKKRFQSSSFNEREKEFDELESEILKDVNEVSKSIDKVLEDRKEIQLEHRKWLEDRKKKIWETRKNTRIIKGANPRLF